MHGNRPIKFQKKGLLTFSNDNVLDSLFVLTLLCRDAVNPMDAMSGPILIKIIHIKSEIHAITSALFICFYQQQGFFRLYSYI